MLEADQPRSSPPPIVPDSHWNQKSSNHFGGWKSLTRVCCPLLTNPTKSISPDSVQSQRAALREGQRFYFVLSFPFDKVDLYKIFLLLLRHKLNNTTGLGDLLLGQAADPSCADNQGDFGETALAEDLGVAEGEEVEDGDGVLLLAGDVGVTGLSGDERPQLLDVC